MLTSAQFDFAADEETKKVIHKHWFVFFGQAVGLMILFLLPFVFIPFVGALIAQGGAAIALSAGLVLFLSAVWSLIFWCKLFASWTNYYFDCWIVTNERIIDVDQIGFFNRRVAGILSLEHIEDITVHIDGFFGTLLNFGTLQVQTGAVHREFVIQGIGNPQLVEHMIREAREQYATSRGLAIPEGRAAIRETEASDA